MSGDDAIVHIETMLSQLSSSSASNNPKIFKVNSPLRLVNEKAYDPVLVAIGPIHSNKDNLKSMEQHKIRFLHQLLTRNEMTVEMCVRELRMLEREARQFYENSIKLPIGDEFIEMLLLDGIFVIELLRRYTFEFLRRADDNIFQFSQVFNQIRRDLLLIENQLPFLVLNMLCEKTKTIHRHDNLQYLFLHMMEGYIRWMRPYDEARISHQYIIDDHLTGLLYKSNFSNDNEEYMPNHFDLDEIKTISELNEAGIQFKPAHDGRNWTDASFKEGVLYLPLLRLYDKTESVLRNLIVYEQMLPKELPRPMTNYSSLMQCMIHSAKDVEILRRAGIIRTWLGDDETAHVMINKLGKNIMMNGNFTYFKIIQEMNGYCRRRRKRWMVILKRNYFNSPCAVVSIIAATILLALTIVQAVFAVLANK